MTYNEIVFICKDLLKIISDDATFEDEHIIFLASKFRNLLIKKYYDTPKKTIPDSMYQTICLDLTYSDHVDICGINDYLVSVQEVPFIIPIGNTKVFTLDYFLNNIEFVSHRRFSYIGNSKYINNIIFATIAPNNNLLYLKSGNKNFLSLEKIKVTAIFEDINKVNDLLCACGLCCRADIMEQQFPIEDALVPELIELIIKDLAMGIYHPADPKNNANDDLSNIMQFIRQNMKDSYLKNYEN